MGKKFYNERKKELFMLDYTRGALNKVLEDFKKIALAVNIGVQVFSILYLVYALIARTGFFAVNLVLLALTVAYFLFFLIMEFTNGAKKTRKIVREIYSWGKRVIKAFTIGLTTYGLFVVTRDFNPLSLFLLLMMVLGFILDILFCFIIRFLTAEIELIITGVKLDVEEIKKPIQAVGNFFKRIKGEEVAPAPVLTKREQKMHDLLTQHTTQMREQRQSEKERIKAEKLNAKKSKKIAKKSVQRIPAPKKNENDGETAVTLSEE
jgi:hypothetical protein